MSADVIFLDTEGIHYWMSRGDTLLDVYLVRPDSSFTSSCIVQGISDHYGVMLELEREESGCEPQVERVVPVYK
jgi:hypothetical protein